MPKNQDIKNNTDTSDIRQPLYVSSFKPEDRLLKLSEVEKIVCLKKPTIYRLMNDHTAKRPFPKNIIIGKRSVAWIEREIYAYLNQCINTRNQKNN